MDKLDEAIAHGQRMEDAGKDGWPCGEMLFYGFLCFLAFVVLPYVMGMGG